MDFVEIVIAIGLASVAFTAGFLARGLFTEEEQDEAALERASSRYEPPRRK
jgi:hypothetical protein